jgi:hypothetical protein
MNDVKSLLIATTVLAIGGLGLYMYKSEDSEELYLNNDFDDDVSDTESDTSSHASDVSSHIEEEDIDDYYVAKEKNNKTRKNNKKNSGTRKKY